MTEMITDVLGYGWAFQQHCARAWMWCIKHREQYSPQLTTAGMCYWCESCDKERMVEIFYNSKTPLADLFPD